MTNATFNSIIKGKKLKIDTTLNDRQFMNRVHKILEDLGEEKAIYARNHNIEIFSAITMKRIQNIKKKPTVTIG